MNDGSAYAYNVNTQVLTQIAGFQTFSGTIDLTIWQGSTVLIVDSAAGLFSMAPRHWRADSDRRWTRQRRSWVTFLGGDVCRPGRGKVNLEPTRRRLMCSGGSPPGSPPGSVVDIDAIPLGPAGTTARKLYRTVAGNTGNFLLVTTINDNFTTAFADDIADADLGADGALGWTNYLDRRRPHRLLPLRPMPAGFGFRSGESLPLARRTQRTRLRRCRRLAARFVMTDASFHRRYHEKLEHPSTFYGCLARRQLTKSQTSTSAPATSRRLTTRIFPRRSGPFFRDRCSLISAKFCLWKNSACTRKSA